MRSSRRSFFEEVLASAGAAALLASKAGAQTTSSSDIRQIQTSDFWGSFYDPPARGKPRKSAVAGKDVRYLYYDSTGLRYIDRLQKQDLLAHSGDVSVSVTLGQFRPGREDARAIKELQSSQLRIDCVQTKPFLNILAPSTWIALASLFTDSAGKLPSLQQLGFQQSNVLSGQNKVILPGGAGKFAVNISSMTKESTLHKILRQGVSIGGKVSPLFGFPAISIPAAQAFTAIYSLLEERAHFVMSSPQIDAAATQHALETGDIPPAFIPLKTGDYILVPVEHVETLAPDLPYLQINQGWLVDQRDKSNRPVDQKGNDTAPDVTYATIKMTVAPITLPSPSDSSSDQSNDSSSSGKSGQSSKAPPKKK